MELKEHEGRTLRYLIVEPDGYKPDEPYPMVVMLHGYGSHMGDLAGLCQAIETRKYLYAFPNAPVPLQVGLGPVGYAWAHPPEDEADEPYQAAEEKLAVFLEDVMQRHDVAPGQVVLGGFSQGGLMTYRWGLANTGLFRGLAALSARLQGPEALQRRLPAGRTQRIFVAHGTSDTLIPVSEAREARKFLEEQGYAPEYREYEMAHQVGQEELEDLVRWLRDTLA